MQAPKILPWMASKGGISDELALKLWRRAAGESEELCGSCDSADYYAETVNRFIDLIEDESGTKFADLHDGARSNWAWRQQKRMTASGSNAFLALSRLWQTSWAMH